MPEVIPVFLCKLYGDALYLICDAIFAGDPKTPFQCSRYRIEMLRLVLPKEGAAGMFPAAGVCYIKYISDFRIVAGSIQKPDAPCSAPDKSAHLFIPEVVFRTGGRVWPLCENHKLLMVGVLIQPCSGSQESRPALQTAGDAPSRFLRHLCIKLILIRHRHPP